MADIPCMLLTWNTQDAQTYLLSAHCRYLLAHCVAYAHMPCSFAMAGLQFRELHTIQMGGGISTDVPLTITESQACAAHREHASQPSHCGYIPHY